MNRLLTVCVLMVVACSPVLARTGPELACLSDRSVDDLFADSKIQTGPKLFLVLVGEDPFSKSAFEQDDWERSVWNDPEFAAFLSEQKIPVIYMSGKENAAFYSTLDISSLPRVLLYQGSVLRSSRAGLAAASDSSRTSMIEWIKQVQTGITPVEAAYLAVDEDPENAVLRMNLMDELWKERRETESIEQLCWLIDHNDLYAEHTLSVQQEKTGEHQSEIDVRVDLYWRIMSLRDNLQLFNSNTLGGDGWDLAEKRVENANAKPWQKPNPSRERLVKEHRLLLDLRSKLEARRDDQSASDRDLFLLRVMTSEGDDLKQLAEEMMPHLKRK